MPRDWKSPMHRARAWPRLLLALTVAACMEATGPQATTPDRPAPSALKSLLPDNLSGEAGFPLAEPVRVQLVDGKGGGVAGETVAFAVIEGGGTVTPAEVQTDAEGVAQAQWQLGPTPGANTLRVSAAGKSVTLHATGAEGRGTTIIKVSGGTADSLPAGCMLGEPLLVKVTDLQGKPVAGASVGFEAVQGDGVASPAVATTDAEGIARAQWKLGFQGGANEIRAVLHNATRPSVTFTARSAPAAPNGFSVMGNQIYEPATCKPILFHGAARPALQWYWAGDERWVNIGDDMKNLRSWGATIVRIPITQVFWLAGNKQYDPGYKARVIDAVTKARAQGLAVVLDLHASDRGNPDYAQVPDIQKLPDERNSVPFWRDVATTFKGDGGVIFELYNEPHEVTWDQWLNGADIPEGPDYPGGPVREAYKAVGMQRLYDEVRATGAKNLVMVGGMHWGYFLDEVATHRVKGYNIIYSAHPYDWPDKQPDTWEAAFGSLAATDPVVISEFGSYDCTRLWYTTAVMDYADRKGMSWIAWAWWTPPPVSATYTAQQRQADICKFPALITDWNGTPSPSGELIKARLASYR
ncbi:MAG TPA: cellulase family glycosylhydrolase [Gemmatimonadaceae bacterium]